MGKLDELLNIIAKSGLEQGGVKFESLECILKSGRRFRYQLNEYPFDHTTTPEQAEALARRIVSDKYLNCQWDRDHVQNDSEAEIVETIKTFIMDWAKRMKQIHDSQPTQSDIIDML